MADNYEQFRDRYRDMADEELLQLAEQSGDLVEAAHGALWDELESRGLKEEAEERNSPQPEAPRADLHETALLADYRRRGGTAAPAEELGLSLVYSTESADEAAEIQRLLTDHGISSQLQVMILVPTEDANKAYKLVDELPGLQGEVDLS